MKINVVEPRGGEPIENGPLKIRILEDGSRTRNQVGVAEVMLDPGAKGPPHHFHKLHEETFYVVRGTVRFTSGEEHVDVGQGGFMAAPLLAPHTFSNPDPENSATVLVTFSPDLYIQYFREMREMELGPEGISDEADLELMDRYQTYDYEGPEAEREGVR